MNSLSGNVFQGPPSLGAFWDDWFSDKNKSKFTLCPDGLVYNYNPSKNDGQCIVPAGENTTIKIDGKPVSYDPSSPCGIPGFEPVRREDGTYTCVNETGREVVTESATWGKVKTTAGGDSYNPAGSSKCPSGSFWSPYEGKCVTPGGGDPARLECPKGTKLDPINFTCDKVAPSGGGGGGTAQKKPPEPTPKSPTDPGKRSLSSKITPLAIVAGVLVVGAVGAVVYKVAKKKKTAKSQDTLKSNEYEDQDEDEY